MSVSHYPYLVVGGGMAADAAVRGIRELDPQGVIGLIGAEADPPYARPPLSKALWKGEPVESVWRKTSEVAGVDLHLGRRATGVDVYYLSAGRVRGVLLWNTWGQVDAARALIAEPGPFNASDLKGRLQG